MVAIKEVTHNSKAYWESIELRDEILRKPLGLEYNKADLEAESDSIHLLAYSSQQELVGCLVLKPLPNQELKMRQVAVKGNQQGKGVGKKLVAYSEDLAKEKGFAKIVLHAREVALPFYQKLQYQTVGDQFEEVGIPHFKMEKHLD